MSKVANVLRRPSVLIETPGSVKGDPCRSALSLNLCKMFVKIFPQLSYSEIIYMFTQHWINFCLGVENLCRFVPFTRNHLNSAEISIPSIQLLCQERA